MFSSFNRFAFGEFSELEHQSGPPTIWGDIFLGDHRAASPCSAR